MADDDTYDLPFSIRSLGVGAAGQPASMFDPSATDPQDTGQEDGMAAVTPAAAQALGGGEDTGNPLDARLNSYMDRLDKAQNRADELQDERRKAMAPLYAGARAAVQEPTEKMEPLEKAPKAPKQELGQGAMEYMQVATVMAALGGVFARRGGTVALNAFSGAIKGFAQGNAMVFKAKSEEWKQASQEVIQNNQAKLDRYKEILANKKMNIDQKMEEIKIVASQYGDEISSNLATQRNYTALIASIQKQMQLTEQMKINHGKLDREVSKYNNALEDRQNMIDGSKSVAEEIRAGKMPPTTNGMGLKEGAMVKNELAKSKFDLAKAQLEWEASKKQILSLNGPQMTRFAGLAKSVDLSIDRLLETSREMKNSGIPLLNRANLERYIQLEGNSPKGQLAAKYLADVNTVKEEFANLAQGGYAPTEAAWSLANQQINGNYGVKELEASVSEVQRLIRYRVAAIPGFTQSGPSAPNRYRPQAPANPHSEEPGGTAPSGDGWSIVKPQSQADSPMKVAGMSPEEKARMQRRIENAEGDKDLMKIRRDLEKIGIDPDSIPALKMGSGLG